jgi:hypothetical protein
MLLVVQNASARDSNHQLEEGREQMIELIATAGIMASSVLLFAYWFRYTCLLIISAKTTRDYAVSVATANQLGFLQVQSQLSDSAPGQVGLPELDRLKDALDRDYKVLTYLLKNAANGSTGEDSIEKRMLEINYRVMRAWYGVSRQFSQSAASRAIEEMALVVAHFANSMGERSAVSAAA